MSVIHLNLVLHSVNIDCSYNGTLPVVSSVKYHFLLIFLLKNLHNFSIIETVNISSTTVAISGMFVVLFITNSQFVTTVITNVMSISFEKKKINLSLLC